MKPGVSDFGRLLEQKYLGCSSATATGTDRGSNRYFPADFATTAPIGSLK